MNLPVPFRQMMEGVGDEVLYCIIVMLFLGIVTLAIYLYTRFSSRGPYIHPTNDPIVSNVRNELGHQGLSSNAPRRGNDSMCPICLASASNTVETNCGHYFCGSCILTYWRVGGYSNIIKCPSCRQMVTLLLICFSEQEDNEAIRDIVQNVSLYNRKFSGQPLSILEYLQDLPTLLRHCFNDFFSIGGLFWLLRVRILFYLLVSIIYLLSPLDIIPEAGFGFFGLLDDVFVIFFVLIHITISYRQFVVGRDVET